MRRQALGRAPAMATRYNSRYSRQHKLTPAPQLDEIGGRGRDRTGDPLLAKSAAADSPILGFHR